jgi:T5SS/PEP-CTERM-associated repeat protein
LTNSGSTWIGTNADSIGEAIVTGNNSNWTNGSELQVGSYGSGTLQIEAAGNVSNEGNGYIGTFDGSFGAVTVRGAGSTWTGGTQLHVGSVGTGTLRIEAGGSVSNNGNGYLGTFSGSSGTAVVTGDGATWTNRTELQVGSNGSGTLQIEAGGNVSNVGNGYIGTFDGSFGTVTVRGAGSTWTNQSELQVASNGRGTLSIEDGGRVSSQAGFIGTFANGLGTVNVTGSGSTWTNAGSLRIGSRGSGLLRIADGALVSTVSSSVGDQQGADGAVTVTGMGSTLTNSGLLSIGNGGTGVLTVADEGIASASFGVLVGSTGTIAGNGSVAANVANFGTVSPGAPVGTLSITGNYSQDSTATLELEFGGIELGAEYDSLQIGGLANLNGTLDVALLDGFVLAAGQAFNILTASAGVSGTFVTELLPALSGGLLWNVVYGTNSVVLEVAAPGLSGDFNGDGSVDAADYVVWRDGLGSSFSQSDYDIWRRNFGATSSAAAFSGNQPVPEPASLGIAVVLLHCLALRWSRRYAADR